MHEKNHPFCCDSFVLVIGLSGIHNNLFLFLGDYDDSSTKQRTTDVGEGRITPTGKIILLH